MKGFTIIFGIYAFGFLLAYVLVDQLTRAHIRDDPSNPMNSEFQRRVSSFNWACLIVSAVFGGLMVIAFILKLKYRNVEGMTADEIHIRTYGGIDDADGAPIKREMRTSLNLNDTAT